MIYQNPVRGIIHPLGWTRPAGNTDFAVTQKFGCTGFFREPPLGSCAHFHRGLDLGNGHCGADLLAPAKGIVHFAGKLADGANCVIIDHGSGNFSSSGHLATIVVSKGAAVVAGQKIGTVGETGNATACHDHFALKAHMSGALSFFSDTNGEWVDPWAQLAQNVTVRPKGAGINLRNTAGAGSVLGTIYAETKADGHIHRKSDDADLGLTSQMRKWGGTVTGAIYTANGVTSRSWERIYVGGAYRFVASVLAVKSAS